MQNTSATVFIINQTKNSKHAKAFGKESNFYILVQTLFHFDTKFSWKNVKCKLHLAKNCRLSLHEMWQKCQNSIYTCNSQTGAAKVLSFWLIWVANFSLQCENIFLQRHHIKSPAVDIYSAVKITAKLGGGGHLWWTWNQITCHRPQHPHRPYTHSCVA